MHELLIADISFGKRWKAPLNLGISGDCVSLLLAFQMDEMK